MRPSRILALDCGTAHLACGLFAVTGKGQLRLQQFASEALVVDPKDEGGWLHALTEALRELMAREEFGVKDCVLTVPGHLALTKLVKTPSVGHEQRPRVVQFEATQNIPYPLEEVAWNYLEIADDGVDMEFMLSAAKLEAMEALCASVEAAGLRVLRVETTSLTLWRAYNGCMAEVDSSVLLVDVGARSTEVIMTGGGATQVRTLAIGGNVVTQAMAAQLQVEFPAAEQLKLAAFMRRVDEPVDAITAEACAAAANEFVDRLQRELKRTQLAFLRLPGAVPPRRMVLTGQGAQIPKLAEQLAAHLALPVEKFSVGSTVVLSERAKLDGASNADGQLACLVGLALPFAKPDLPVLDLLPATRRENLQRKLGNKWWLASAALLVLLPLTPLIYYLQEAARLERKANDLEAYAKPMRQMEATNAANLERLGELQKDLSALQAIAGYRTSWLTWLGDMQGRLNRVGDVWLDSVQVEPTGEATAGAETSELRLHLTGRLLDPQIPPGNPSQEALGRANQLFALLTESPFVAKVEGERFAGSGPGILRFELTLVMNPASPL